MAMLVWGRDSPSVTGQAPHSPFSSSFSGPPVSCLHPWALCLDPPTVTRKEGVHPSFPGLAFRAGNRPFDHSHRTGGPHPPSPNSEERPQSQQLQASHLFLPTSSYSLGGSHLPTPGLCSSGAPAWTPHLLSAFLTCPSSGPLASSMVFFSGIYSSALRHAPYFLYLSQFLMAASFNQAVPEGKEFVCLCHCYVPSS